MKEEKNIETVKEFWSIFDERKYRDAEKLLHEEFEAHWVCTRERFNKEEFIKVNEDYPSRWRTVLKRSYVSGDQVISIVHIFSPDAADQFYATSIFTFDDDKIIEIEEYWAAVEAPPEWRKKK
ncbi:MAG: nuclear transport factor 2 family protein [Spirochaetales bacterium]|nr:nuclear transport factor 2 family protein [Spirochaetales bacterium]